MKNTFIIVMFLMSVNLFSQSAGHEPRMPQAGFYENTLSETQVQAFAKRAGQKLQDFGAALQVIGNAEYALSMREKSKTAALKLFDNEKVSVKTQAFPAPQKNTSIQQYLSYLLQNPQKISLQEILQVSPFRKINGSLYQATYQFAWLVAGKKYPFSATLSLKKSTKTFGTEKKEVWEIVIQEMKQL